MPTAKSNRSTRFTRNARRLRGASPQGNARIIGAVVATPDLTVTFDRPVQLTGVPNFDVDVAGADPIGASQSGPAEVTITYDVAIGAATAVTVPPNDPAIRTSVGGFAASTTFPI